MLYRPTSPPFPRQRLSPAGMATAGAIHVALLWLLLQHTPLQQQIRYVVYQYVQPISPPPSTASRAITIPSQTRPGTADNSLVFSRNPESSVPLKTTTQLPERLQAKKPVPAPVPAAAAPEPVPALESAAPPMPAVPAPDPLPSVTPPLPVPVEMPPPPEPVPAPLPLPAPAPVPAPVPVPVPAPAPEPTPVPLPDPVPAPVSPAPAPVPAPLPIPPAPAPAVPAPPAPTAPPAPPAPPAPAPPGPAPAPPAPAGPTQRLQGPVVDVPVAPGSTGAGRATPILVPAPSADGWGRAAPAPPAAGPSVALPPAPVLTPALSPLPGPYRIQRQRSISDMANEQLRRGRPKDPLAEGIESSSIDDCMHAPRDAQQVGGLLAAPALIGRALAGKCAK